MAELFDCKLLAQRNRVRITRWKLSEQRARDLAEDISLTRPDTPKQVLDSLRGGDAFVLGARVQVLA